METLLTILSYLLVLLIVVYSCYILMYYRGLSKLSAGKNDQHYSVSVIVPARNEENNIAQCLLALLHQDYPADKIHLIVVDDQSTDNTTKIVNEYIGKYPGRISLVQVSKRHPNISPKINALKIGITNSTTEILFTTDADCWASPLWISSTIAQFEKNVGVVTGLTVYARSENVSPIFRGIQFLDFISYTAVGAGGIGMNSINTFNGSNMAFRRTAYDEISGFDSLAHLNTGDDSLLAQKIVRTKKWKAGFTLNPDSFVTTHAVPTWKEFFYQRMRWAGQTTEYPAGTLFFMGCTFLMYIGLSVSLPLTIFSWNGIPWIIVAAKFGVDYMIMRKFTILTKTEEALRFFLPTAIVHIPVILFSVFGGFFGQFRWKERTVSRTAL